MKRETILAFSKLLNRVKFQNNWSITTFENCASRTEGVSKSEAIRFYKALIYLGYLVKCGRGYKPSFDTRVWHDDDFRLRGFKQYWLRDEIYKDNKSVKDKEYS